MIEFLTLLLGLSAGPQTVELSVSEEVAEVRLLLDGVVAATERAAPWTFDVDLGTVLRPHLLEAISYDGEGRELGRAEQRLNVPRPAAEVRILLERGEDGRIVAGRLTWESAVGGAPVRIRAWLDGRPVDVVEPSRIPLPEHDASQFHLLRVELEFSAEVAAEAQLAFGGTYLDEARTDLTALPVLGVGRGRRTVPARMADWFRVGDETARVVAFEKGGLDLVLVRGPGVIQAIGSLPGVFEQQATLSAGTTGAGIAEGASGITSVGVTATATQRLQEMMALEPGRRLRLLLPEARRQAGRTVQMEVFALSPEISPEQGGLFRALQQEVDLAGASKALRLADAVAVAGLQAAGGNRRRAVLLVLAREATDHSRHGAGAVREYLQSLRVPLVVWRVGEPAVDGWRPWGRGEEIVDIQDLRRAVRQMKAQLDRQRIVWLDGSYLLDEIRIEPGAEVQSMVRRDDARDRDRKERP